MKKLNLLLLLSMKLQITYLFFPYSKRLCLPSDFEF